MINKKHITGLLLSGGQAKRLSGIDKGLLKVNQQPLMQHGFEVLKKCVGKVFISANRNIKKYQQFAPVIQDESRDFQGPLAGIAAALQVCKTPYLLVIPCDMPNLKADILQTLADKLHLSPTADLCIANDGKRMQPLVALMKTSVLPSLLKFLNGGERKLQDWQRQQNLAIVTINNQQKFCNLNKPSDINQYLQN
ncbi:MAG: molybdenum cofactor guanylyltransferase [Candidatus Thioglobus sp.]|nr:MAG: molybdenum cofactor guanylyltransferase [Candidatus Thioglobus sp.]